MGNIALFQIKAPHFTAGFELADGKIRYCAPIIQWMQDRGWYLREIQAYCKAKGWELNEIT